MVDSEKLLGIYAGCPRLTARQEMRVAMVGVKGIPHTGGIENVVEQIGSRLAERGHEIIVFVRPHYNLERRSEYRGMKLVSLPSINTKHIDAISHSFLSILHLITQQGVDIVHIHSMGISFLALLPGLLKKKTVVTSHGLDWQRKKWGPLAKAFLKLTDYSTVSFPDATTVVSRKLKNYYEKRFRRKVHYIPNGVDNLTKVKPKEIHKLGIQENEYILFASRLVPEKGCHYLVKAYKELKNRSKKLIIAGDSNYRDRYVTELKKYGDKNIIFLGFIRGRLLQELMSNAYIYVQPSEIEGLSTALLEAMSYGDCVVVSEIEENLEVTENCGFSFKNGDYKNLRDILEFLLKNQGIVRKARQRAKHHVLKHYNWDSVTDQYETLYKSLLVHK